MASQARVELLCTVRGCGLVLDRRERRLSCANGHSFDAARSGYINLLQPQDRRSKSPGDRIEAVRSRRRFLEGGYEEPVVTAILESIARRRLRPDATVLDVGCSEGHYLGRMAERTTGECHGLDISTPAVDLAARRYTNLCWVVANADRVLPYADGSFDLVTSITSRRNPDEFHRVLRPSGWLLVVLPAADDLVELREAVLGSRILRDRTDGAVAAFSGRFVLDSHEHVRHRSHLDEDAINDVLASTYRGGRVKERDRLEGLSELTVTLSRDLLWFRPTG